MLLAPPPILEVYYAPSCAPCRLELPAVAEFASQDGARVRIVIVSEEPRARADLTNVSPRLTEDAIAGREPTPRAILRAAGDHDGILPYARSIASDGRVCAQWRGRLTFATAQKLVAACARFLTLPPSRRS